jgi:ubiquinone biosynthesis monooxygenase Coq7
MTNSTPPSDSETQAAPRHPARTNEGWQPGDPTPREFVERVIRVDQAGEFGAVRIYEGQLAALRWRGQGDSPAARKIEHMLAQEKEHRRVFDAMLADRRVRPTALSPLWSVTGFALGAATALLGDAAAMACTVAVEDAIDEHYTAQRERLGDDEAELRDTVERFRRDEVAHRDEALASGAEKAPAYELLTGFIRNGSRLAIWLSTRV